MTQETFNSKILVLVQDGAEKEEVTGNGLVEVVTEATPFYGEAGGQVGDVGVIEGASGKMNVEQTLKDPTGLIIHQGRMLRRLNQKRRKRYPECGPIQTSRHRTESYRHPHSTIRSAKGVGGPRQTGGIFGGTGSVAV